MPGTGQQHLMPHALLRIFRVRRLCGHMGCKAWSSICSNMHVQALVCRGSGMSARCSCVHAHAHHLCVRMCTHADIRTRTHAQTRTHTCTRTLMCAHCVCMRDLLLERHPPAAPSVLPQHAPLRYCMQVLLEPTVIYVKKVVALHEKVTLKGVVHITGGGMTDNIPRVIPKGLGVEIDTSSYQVRAQCSVQAVSARACFACARACV